MYSIITESCMYSYYIKIIVSMYEHSCIFICIYIAAKFSSSEDEHEDEDDETSIPTLIDNNADMRVNSLLTWFIIFLSLWQSAFTIPDKALEALLKFIKIFFTFLASQASLLPDISTRIPSSLHLLRKYSNSQEDCFVKYVTCPSCYSIYPFETCFHINELRERVPKNCSYKHFPNHPYENRRLSCIT